MNALFRLGFLALAAVAFFTGALAIVGAPVPRLVTAAMAFYAGWAALTLWWDSWKRPDGPGGSQ